MPRNGVPEKLRIRVLSGLVEFRIGHVLAVLSGFYIPLRFAAFDCATEELVHYLVHNEAAVKLKSALAVAAIKKTGDHAVGQGLYLRVTASGSRSWILRYQRQGQAHKMGLGSYPTVTLAAARVKAHDANLLLAGGRDPIAQRQRAAPLALTFQSAGEECIADKREGWRHDKTAHHWGASRKHAYK